MKKKIKFILTIAGSDSSGGAGIQSDLKTFRNHGLYGLSVVTSITAQNTMGVQSIFELPPEMVKAQLKSLFEDFDIKVVKTGMLSSEKVLIAVKSFLKEKIGIKLIIDPVIRSKNGHELLSRKGVIELKENLFPLSCLVTPNLPEAEILAGMKIKTVGDVEEALRKILSFGCKNVLLKGGHFPSRLGIDKGTDIWYDGKKFHLFRSKFVDTKNTHGIGCAFSSAIASNIALGYMVKESIVRAKTYIITKLEKSQKIGKGFGPVEQI